MKTYSFRKTKQNGGAAMIIAVIFFLVIAVIFTVGVASPILDEMHIANNLVLSDQSYYTSESGIEDMSYRLKNSLTVPSSGGTDTISLNGSTSSTTAITVTGGEQLNSVGDQQNMYRKVQAVLAQGSGASFYYGLQTGVGGISLGGSSGINGNVYATGPITGSVSTKIKGNAISAGSAGLIQGVSQYNQIQITGSAYAHSIQSASVGGSAYYQTISGSTVSGTSYPGSIDQSVPTLPISDSQISGWETQAQGGGVVTSPCPYTIGGSSAVTLGPIEIKCDLTITNSAVVTLAGPVWVTGNVTIGGSATVKESSSLGNNSVQIIADNPSNDSSSGEITVTDGGQITGNSKSFVLLVSQNNSAQNGGSNVAITASGAATGNYTLYASHGEVTLQGSANLTGAIGYLLSLLGSSQVTYNTGLASMTFSSGSAGGYTFSSWGETQ